MKIKIKTDDGEKEIEFKKPKGRHTKKGFKLLTSVVKEDGTEDLQALNKYTEYLDEMTAELTGMSIDELDDLDAEEKDKLVKKSQEIVMTKLDFLKSSLKQENSGQKEEVQ